MEKYYVLERFALTKTSIISTLESMQEVKMDWYSMTLWI